MTTAEQIRQVIDNLPNINSVKSDFYRVAVEESPDVIPSIGASPHNKCMRYFEFMKNNGHWVLVSMPEYLKDHQIAELVNTLRDIAIKYHDTQQLREQIAHVLVPVLKR